MVYSDKWNWRFKEIINQHPIMWHPNELEKQSAYFVPRKMSDLIDKAFPVHCKEYRKIIGPMFHYLQGYTKSVSGYKHYTRTDLKICLKLMDKYMLLYKNLLRKQKISAIEMDF